MKKFLALILSVVMALSLVACCGEETPAEGGEVIFSCEGKVEGVIIPEQRGNGGFGYDPMFYVKEYDKTFGELSADEKNLISHRANALKQVAEFLDSYGK